MPERNYLSYQNNVINYRKVLATKEMINAGKEEYQLAVEAGDVKNGTPEIAVILDGAWFCQGLDVLLRQELRKYMRVKNRFCLTSKGISIEKLIKNISVL
ncbi:hypothetical protein BDFB_014377 [Asbolus verrucosus]|uniref:Uncharacterized protein n=1 Tax=Asbolus verrucosus TaxID=1661398 RepID=A0A482VSE6_ASBVE|nr:hypothetical protein BDFB_014377 [Asbolus verrucosus]